MISVDEYKRRHDNGMLFGKSINKSLVENTVANKELEIVPKPDPNLAKKAAALKLKHTFSYDDDEFVAAQENICIESRISLLFRR